MFYTLPILDWYLRTCSSKTAKATVFWALHRCDFLLLPFLWFAIKREYFRPHGLYAGYNEDFAFRNLLYAFKAQGLDLLNISIPVTVLFAAIAVIAVLYSYLHVETNCLSNRRQTVKLLVGGLLAVFLAMFPYWIVGKATIFHEWDSRNQLLMPLGISVLALVSSQALRPRYREHYIMSLIAISVAMNWHAYAMLYNDWGKQLNIIAFFRHSKDVASADLILFDDQAPNAMGRYIRFYEWNGMLKAAYGDETRFGINAQNLLEYNRGDLDRYFSASYNAANHNRRDGERTVRVSILPGPHRGYLIKTVPPS